MIRTAPRRMLMNRTNNSTGHLRPAAGQSKQKKSTVRFYCRPGFRVWHRPQSQAELAERQQAARRAVIAFNEEGN